MTNVVRYVDMIYQQNNFYYLKLFVNIIYNPNIVAFDNIIIIWYETDYPVMMWPLVWNDSPKNGSANYLN
jgi:hypothetical protein